MSDNNKYQEYFEQYNAYIKTHELGNKYLKAGEIVTQTNYYRLMNYQKCNTVTNNIDTTDKIKKIHKTEKCFLIIPSIFNSAEILFLAREKSFIENLQEQGEIFLIDWLEIKEPEYLFDDYVHKVIEVIDLLVKNKNINNLNLIGHCIGGNIAIAVSLIKTKIIKSLTLLTCPWDLSHFFAYKKLYEFYNIGHYVAQLPQIPKSYLQILFFLLSPDYFNIKLTKFFALTDMMQKDLVFRVENWLLSGHNMPRTTYLQLMCKILEQNMFKQRRWQIGNQLIDPSLLNKPVYLIVAADDYIAPKSSILPLHQLFPNSMVIEVSGGHISYLLNNSLTRLWEEYKT